jgi:hypothetical protein
MVGIYSGKTIVLSMVEGPYTEISASAEDAIAADTRVASVLVMYSVPVPPRWHSESLSESVADPV